MAKTILGKVSIVPAGAWNKDTVYTRLDAVAHNGSGYIAVQDSTNIEPGTDPLAWMLLVEKGDPFTFEDFTPEQIALLQNPATAAAEQAAQATKATVNATENAVEATKHVIAATKEANIAIQAAIDAAGSAETAAQAAKDAAADVKSAYDAAVAGGFTGTEEEFNQSIATLGDLTAVLDAINGEVL